MNRGHRKEWRRPEHPPLKKGFAPGKWRRAALCEGEEGSLHPKEIRGSFVNLGRSKKRELKLNRVLGQSRDQRSN